MPEKQDSRETSRPARATARPVFEGVAERLQVDASLLAYLFGECLSEILDESQSHGSCTLRGLGRFRHATPAELTAKGMGAEDTVTVFERTRHIGKNTPFTAFFGRRPANF